MPFPGHLLTDWCLISRFEGRGTGAFREAEYGPWKRVRCAFQESFQKVRDPDGNERVSASNLATRDRIGLEDRVILPTANGVIPAIPTTDQEAADRSAKPIAHRNDRSRISGFRLYQTFF